MVKKHLFMRYFIVIFASSVFLYIFFFSPSGINRYLKLKYDISKKEQEIVSLEKTIKRLEISINNLSKPGFELEKIARQDLQMGYPYEKVYLL